MKFTTLDKLLANPPEVVGSLWGESLLPSKGLTLLHSGSKIGKSMLSMNLALAGARGDSAFLGQPIAKPFSTLIFQGEIHLRGVFERFDHMVKTIAERGGITGEQLANIYINEDRTNRLSDDATFLTFREEVRKVAPDLIVLDPLAHVLTVSENDNAVVGAMLERLATLRDDPGCAILLIHHDAKVSEATAMRSPQQRARGADRLNADPDCILSLVPGARLAGGPTGKLHIASRYGRSVPPFTIMLNEDNLWFEQYIDRGDPIQIAMWITERGVDRIEENLLVAIVEAGWQLKDERQHRAAKRYIARAEAEGFIMEEELDGVKYFAVRAKEDV